MIKPFSNNTGFQPAKASLGLDRSQLRDSSVSQPLSNDFGFRALGEPASSVFEKKWKSPLGHDITQFTLGNGHRIVVEQRPMTNFIGLRTFVDAGSILEDAILPSPYYTNVNLPSGIAHLDEHCRFLTTQQFPLKNTWTNKVNALGARWNASTSPEVIQHELFFNKEELPVMLKLHAESILHPLYKAEDLTQEKRNVINEARLRTREPSSKIYNKLSELLFSRPDNQTLGLQEEILKTTPLDLQYFRQLAYAPKNLTTVISGNVQPYEVLQVLGSELLKNPVGNRTLGNKATKLTLRPNQIASGVIQDPQISNSIVALAFPAPDRSSFKERMAMEFIDDLLDGTALAPFQESLVNCQQLSNKISTSYEPLKATGSYSIIMETEPGKEHQLLQGVLGVLKTVLASPPTRDMVNKTRKRLIERFIEEQTDVTNATMRLGSEAVSQTIPYYLNYANIAGSITPADLVETARKYLQPSRYVVVYGVNPSEKTAPGLLNSSGQQYMPHNPFVRQKT